MNSKKQTVHTLVECAILVALSVVLSFIKVWRMPLGGSVTFVSMLPIFVLSVRHGMRWGFGASFVYALFQLLFGITLDGLLGWGLTPAMLVGCMAFDYLIAFSVLGVSGAFRKYGEGGVYAGAVLACGLRFLSHFLSGYVIFKNLEQFSLFGGTFVHHPVLYSAAYNGLFMSAELVFTLVVTVILMRIPLVKKKMIVPQKY